MDTKNNISQNLSDEERLDRWQHLLEAKVQGIDLRLTAVLEELKDIRAEAELDRRCWMRDGNRLTKLEDEVRGDTTCLERRYGKALHPFQKGLADKLADLTDVVDDLKDDVDDLKDEVHGVEGGETDG
ncbi:MAG: hypothetical protein LUE89_09535 [Clostridiales bacterium]|nr:hypothetical protein [Clostridiales bacterium]